VDDALGLLNDFNLLDFFLCVVPFGCSAAGTVKLRATGALTRETPGRTISAIYHAISI
jgi:hypothetical protein